jgi:hypothetical protein
VSDELGRLIVVEHPNGFFVAREDDPADWLASFAKEPGFRAYDWAHNMVSVYNRRRLGGRRFAEAANRSRLVGQDGVAG